MRKLKISGQNLTELALYFAIITAAILSMGIYVQRSLQAKYKTGVGYLCSKIEQEAVTKGISNLSDIPRQYDPYYRESSITETKEPGSYVILGFPETSLNQTTNRTGWEKVGSIENAD